MFSRLDPLFKTQLRHTETLDTRQGIRRQESPLNKEKSGGDKDEENKEDEWQDSTNVSVRALRSFLEQLANESQAKPAAEDNGKENIQISGDPDARAKKAAQEPKSRNAAHAAQAYQKTYRATHTDDTPAISGDAIPSIELRPEELRVIHQLIKDLSMLAENNIPHLTIRKSESFLQSLVDAVELAKLQL